jgi:hypothetical protein
LGLILGTAHGAGTGTRQGRRLARRHLVLWRRRHGNAHGERAFKGDDITEVLAKVIDASPTSRAAGEHPARPAPTPRCLNKDPKQRLRDIGEARSC